MTDRLSPRIYADLVGKPYGEGGRGPEIFDCGGLAIELQRRQGRDVPDYAWSVEKFHRDFDQVFGILGPCRQVEKPQVGGVVLLRMGITELHIGTMISPYEMLHTTSQLGRACMERLLDPLWRRRVIGYYAIGGGE